MGRFVSMADLCSLIASKNLKDLGFNVYCEYTFYNHYRVKDEIYEKHPGLSDDGYQDLLKKYGGPYKESEVYGYYVEPLKIGSSNKYIDEHTSSEICSCPTLYDGQKFLREQFKKHITVYSCSQESWQYRITDPHQNLDEGGFGEDFATYEDALNDAIERVTTELMKKE